MSGTHMGLGDNFSNTGFQNNNTGGGIQINQIGLDEEARQDRRCLSYMQQSGYDPAGQKENAERRKEKLFEPACEWIFKNPEFQQWSDGASAPGLWLHGGPGKGKTKLLCSVLNHLLDSARVASIYDLSLIVTYSFFSDSDGDREALFVVATLIYGLVQQQPSYLRRISEVYDHESKYPFQGKRSFATLARILKGMLKDMVEDNPTRTQIILVVDALDECKADPDLDQVLDLILETSSTPNVRWLVSSRGLPVIHQMFDAPDTKIRKLSLDQTGQDIQQAVQAYIHHQMESLHHLKMRKDKREELQDQLLRNAGGTFLWLSIVIAELRKGHSWKASGVFEGLANGLKTIYEIMLQNLLRDLAVGGDSEVDREIFHKTLATTTAALRPLHIEELKELAGFPEEIEDTSQVEEVIDKCGAFLTSRNNQVFLIHLSAKEFLTPEKLQSAFQSNPLDIHSHLFSRSMYVMGENLKRDIYNLKKAGISIWDIDLTPSPDPLSGLKYSCVHWIDHLRQVQKKEQLHHEAVRCFIEKCFLYWLEAMSLQKKIIELCMIVHRLRSLMQGTKDYELDTLTEDIESFVFAHSETIRDYPLQTYISALLFSPASSCVRRLYTGEEPNWISLKSKSETTWSHRDKSLSMLAPPWRVAISRDGSFLASISDPDWTDEEWEERYEWDWDWGADSPHSQHPSSLLEIWELDSHELISRLGLNFIAFDIGFLSDGKRLALAGDQNRFEIWNAEKGLRLQTLQSPDEPDVRIACLAFSTSINLDLNEDVIASGSDNGVVRFWNPATGDCTRSMRTPRESVVALKFSQDGQKLAVGLADGTIEVWDHQSGALIWEKKAHNRFIVSMAFLGDDQLASTSGMEGMLIWDPKTGDCIRTLCVPTLTMVVSLESGGHFASAAYDEQTVSIWNNKGDCIQLLGGSRLGARALAFCPEQQVLVRAAANEVDIWDLKLFRFPSVPLHIKPVLSTTCSSDSRLFASGSDDSIKIWNTADGSWIRSIDCAEVGGCDLAFSPNSRYLISGGRYAWSNENSTQLTIWNVEDGQVVKTFPDVRKWEAFSADGRLLALALESSVMVWDMDVSKQHYQIRCRATCLVFSAVGYKLALASNTTLEIWDMRSGERIWAVAHQQTGVTSIALSADTKLLAAGSYRYIDVWDVSHNELRVSIPTTQRSHATFGAVTFSPNGELLAWVRNGEIGIGDFKNGRVARFPFDCRKRNFSIYERLSPKDSGRATIQFKRPGYSRLCTSIGDLDIDADGTLTGFRGFHLDQDHRWIMRDQEKMVLLPEEYQGGSASILLGQGIAIGGDYGGVLLFQFD